METSETHNDEIALHNDQHDINEFIKRKFVKNNELDYMIYSICLDIIKGYDNVATQNDVTTQNDA